MASFFFRLPWCIFLGLSHTCPGWVLCTYCSGVWLSKASVVRAGGRSGSKMCRRLTPEPTVLPVFPSLGVQCGRLFILASRFLPCLPRAFSLSSPSEQSIYVLLSPFQPMEVSEAMWTRTSLTSLIPTPQHWDPLGKVLGFFFFYIECKSTFIF